MSDLEDEMDIDAPLPQNKSIQFSSDNTAGKGKRIVADLPVEAGDNLPWCVRTKRLHYFSADLLPQGRKISTQYTLRCFRSSRHPGYNQQICRTQCAPRSFSTLLSTVLFTDLPPSAPPSSPSLWTSGHGQDLHHSRPRATNLRQQEHASDGP